MKIYFAGNFPIMTNVEEETKFKTFLGKNYNRLCTYYYPRSADIVIKGEDPNEKKRTARRIKKSKTRSRIKRNS